MRAITIQTACSLVVIKLGAHAHAETVVPMKGQTPEQIQSDTATCQTQAKSAYDQALAAANQSAATSTTTASQPSGGRARGAAAGAVAGAAAAEVRGNQYENYDKVDSDVQKEYRQNEAQEAAVAGAVVGGSRQRRDRRQQTQAEEKQAQQQSATAEQSADAASKQTFSACISSKGYTISP